MSYRAFTIRIPEDLFDQVQGRAAILRRSRNTEITELLIRGIDASVAEDLKYLETMQKKVDPKP